MDDYDFTLKYGNILTNLSDHNTQIQIIVKQKDRQTIVSRFHCNGKKINEINKKLQNIHWAAKQGLCKNIVSFSTDLLLKKKDLKRFLGTLRTNFE